MGWFDGFLNALIDMVVGAAPAAEEAAAPAASAAASGAGSGVASGIGGGLGSMIVNAAVPGLVNSGIAAGSNALFGHPPQVQTTDTRTPDQMALNGAQVNTYKQLAQDYTNGQHAMPLWDPIEQQDIRRRTLAEMARSGVQDSGQAMTAVNKNLSSYRMGVAQQHEQNQIQRAGQLSNISMPSQQANVMPGYNMASTTPYSPAVNVGSAPKPTANDTIGKDANGGQPVATKNPYDPNAFGSV